MKSQILNYGDSRRPQYVSAVDLSGLFGGQPPTPPNDAPVKANGGHPLPPQFKYGGNPPYAPAPRPPLSPAPGAEAAARIVAGLPANVPLPPPRPADLNAPQPVPSPSSPSPQTLAQALAAQGGPPAVAADPSIAARTQTAGALPPAPPTQAPVALDPGIAAALARPPAAGPQPPAAQGAIANPPPYGAFSGDPTAALLDYARSTAPPQPLSPPPGAGPAAPPNPYAQFTAPVQTPAPAAVNPYAQFAPGAANGSWQGAPIVAPAKTGNFF